MNLIKTESFEIAIYSQGDSGAKKVALVLPGKLDTKDYFHMVSHVNYLASLGFFALSFDPPGTWESPGEIALYNVTNYIKAINEIINYYGNKQTFLVGHSRGGSMAMLAGCNNPYVSSFASIMSFSYKKNYKDEEEEDWKKNGYVTSMRDLPPGGGEKIKKFNLPFSFLEDQKQYDIYELIKKSSKPKLFVLGKQDDLVPPQTVREAYSVASDPKELYEIDSGHDYRRDLVFIEEINRVIGNFLKKFNI
jgi:pimeloyl-ACP methyl ester carboxylesterase